MNQKFLDLYHKFAALSDQETGLANASGNVVEQLKHCARALAFAEAARMMLHETMKD